MSDAPTQPDPGQDAVAARVAMLIEMERRASEERKSRRQRRQRIATAILLLPLVLLTLYALVAYLSA